VELVDEQRKRAVVGYVREYNEQSPIVEAPQGVLNPDLAFGISRGEASSLSNEQNDHDIDTFVYTTTKVLDKVCLERIFHQLPKNIIRYKGYVNTNEGLKIINGI
jgi:G3E family GTPase